MFIEKIRKDRAFKKFKKAKKNKNIKLSFENMIDHMGTFKKMSENDITNLKEYDTVLSKLVANLKATIKNFQVIEEAIKTIENG